MQLSFESAAWPERPRRFYKTPNKDRARAKRRRASIKAAGGEAYEQLLEYERAARKRFRELHRDSVRKANKAWRKRNGVPFKTRLCKNARSRARKRGLEGTIRPEDLVWPSHCPVLGIELAYPTRGVKADKHCPPNYPSLDRWDSSKGYVPGNVFVISFRANMLKNNARPDEIWRLAKYMARKPKYG